MLLLLLPFHVLRGESYQSKLLQLRQNYPTKDNKLHNYTEKMLHLKAIGTSTHEEQQLNAQQNGIRTL